MNKVNNSWEKTLNPVLEFYLIPQMNDADIGC